jgi:hypothetical protein
MFPLVTDKISSSEGPAGGKPETEESKGRTALYNVKHDVIIKEITELLTENWKGKHAKQKKITKHNNRPPHLANKFQNLKQIFDPSVDYVI